MCNDSPSRERPSNILRGKLGDSGSDDRSRCRWKVERLKTLLPNEKRHRKMRIDPMVGESKDFSCERLRLLTAQGDGPGRKELIGIS